MRIKLRPYAVLPWLGAIQADCPEFTREEFRALQRGEAIEAEGELLVSLMPYCMEDENNLDKEI